MSRPSLPSLNFQPATQAPTTPSVMTNIVAGELRFPGTTTSIPFTAKDLGDLCAIGRGHYGVVCKKVHKSTGNHLAVKNIRANDAKLMERLDRELKTNAQAQDCSSIVSFMGYVFDEGSCLLCMELMDVSLDHLHTEMTLQKHRFSEKFIWMVAVDVLDALCYLKTALQQMHRDVKPSNILLDRAGNVKLCDFGLTCDLTQSIAASLGKDGCKKYMAPERINCLSPEFYGAVADVWSYGLSLIEVASGRFPYNATIEFKFYAAVVNEPAPQMSQTDLAPDHSEEMRTFINSCLEKEQSRRPKFVTLQTYPFYDRYRNEPVEGIRAHVGEVVSQLLTTIPPFEEAGGRS